MVPVAAYARMSTDHQRYSIDNQMAFLRGFASAHGMAISREYADPGRSGLTLKERPELSRLIADVASGEGRFRAVLVYDVSRWGRFQDADESAHYEFLCKRAGAPVIYCAEPFAAVSGPFSDVMKAIKRAMAGEYSRELSTKVAAGKARIGGMGYRVGGPAGYGLRRRVLEDGRTPGLVLRDGQRKSIQTDRVTLVPGPAEEIAVIRRIYADYLRRGRSCREIAVALNGEGILCGDVPWSTNHVETVLSNEKYIGSSIVCKTAQRLGNRTKFNPPEEWIRLDGVFEAIVPRTEFEAAARRRRSRQKNFIPRDDLLKALGRVLQREGRLTAAIINAAPELPSANTVEARLGSLSAAYEVLGYEVPAKWSHHKVDMRLRFLAMQLRDDLAQQLAAAGVGVSLERDGLLRTVTGRSVELRVCRFQSSKPWLRGWRMCFQRGPRGDTLVAARMQEDDDQILDFVVAPRCELEQLPRLVGSDQQPRLTRWSRPNVQAVALELAALHRGMSLP